MGKSTTSVRWCILFFQINIIITYAFAKYKYPVLIFSDLVLKIAKRIRLGSQEPNSVIRTEPKIESEKKFESEKSGAEWEPEN